MSILKLISTASLAIALLTLSCVYTPTTDPIIQNLLNHNIIERKHVSELEEILEQQQTRSSASYLNGLHRIEFEKEYGDYRGYVSISYDTAKVSNDLKRQIRAKLSDYLSKLRVSGLVNDKQFEKFQSRIDGSEFMDVLHLLNVIGEQVAFDEYMNPEDLKSFAHKLKDHSLVTSRYNELLDSIEGAELKRPIDFLKYCDKAVIISENDYSSRPEDYLEQIHQKTASILPALAFEHFSFQVVLDSSTSGSDSQSYYFLISLKSNGKVYKQRSYYRLYDPVQDKYFGGGIDQQEYYKVFNKLLSDLQSPYRLHEVKAYYGNNVDQQAFGIIALTKEQAEMLHGGGVYFAPSYETFENSLTTADIKLAIEVYQEIGLFDHLTPDQIKAAKERISEHEMRNLNDVLLCFPDVVYMFDMELANLKDPYAELMKAYARISHGEFDPTDISDDFAIGQKKWVTLKFRLKDKHYEQKFMIEDDWIDPKFFRFIYNVVNENSLGGRFYDLYTEGQETSIIYLTKSQYDIMRSRKLAIFADSGNGVQR